MTVPTSTPGPARQLATLVALRWRMVRSARLRTALAAMALAPMVLVLLGMASISRLPTEQAVNLALATPTLYLGFVLLAIIAPLVSGGGYELFPSDQVVAYPLRPATVFRSTLVLAPANLAWMLNVIALFVVTSFASGPVSWGATARSLLVVGAFIGVATVVGHTVGWLVVGVRQSRRGRIVTNLLGVAVLLGGLLVFWSDRVLWILDRSPTKRVLLAAYDGYGGRYAKWVTALVVMAALGYAALRLGELATAWALRRPGDHADRTGSRTLPRRPQQRHPLLALLVVDHASVWRSVPLRRGVLVLMLVPAVVAALAGMSWQSLILIPGLIAAGAGLLFGINAFTLDSSGALWLATLPRWSTYAFTAKVVVFSEIAVGAVMSALLGGSLRADAPVSAAEVTAAFSSAVTCAAIVVAIGMRSSLQHPYRAELRGPRDTPATPGVMAAQSIRFAAVTTVVSLLYGGLAYSGEWWLPLLAAVPALALCGLHLMSTARAWGHPHVRAHVVLSVSGG